MFLIVPDMSSYFRFYYMASSTHYFFYMNQDSVVYDTLPLYHTAGGNILFISDKESPESKFNILILLKTSYNN